MDTRATLTMPCPIVKGKVMAEVKVEKIEITFKSGTTVQADADSISCVTDGYGTLTKLEWSTPVKVRGREPLFFRLSDIDAIVCIRE